MASTVIGFYDTETTARQVMQVLQNSGFTQNAIDFTTGERNASGITEKLVQAGAPREEARLYEQGVKRGGSLVTVTTDDREAARAAEIMQQYEPIYVEALAEWQGPGSTSTGYSQSTSGSASMSAGAASDSSRTASTATMERGASGEVEAIPVVEEEVRVGKRAVERGGVRVRSYVTERPVEEQVRLRDETIHVERRPVDRPVSASDDVFKEKSIELTETDEEAVIAKEARVVEEVVVRKDVDERVETVRDTVRRTDVEVEQLDGSSTGATVSDADFSRFDADFRQHYSTGSFGTEYTYEQVQPAYRYGYTLASDKRYKDRNWSDVESDIRTNWESSNKGTWDRFKDSIRYAWERARS
jgi:uncharacterized protein (TIGR02271 family)